jgi:hypothetical protein
MRLLADIRRVTPDILAGLVEDPSDIFWFLHGSEPYEPPNEALQLWACRGLVDTSDGVSGEGFDRYFGILRNTVVMRSGMSYILAPWTLRN